MLFLIISAGYFAWPLWSAKETKPLEVTNANPITGLAVRQAGLDLLGTDFVVPGVNIAVKLATDIIDYKEGDNTGSVIYLPEHTIKVTVAGKDYIVAPIATNNGGTGTFVYLVLFEKNGNQFKQVDDEFLGDRIKIEKVETTGDKISATIYDRGTGEPYSAVPTVQKTLTYTIVGGALKLQ